MLWHGDSRFRQQRWHVWVQLLGSHLGIALITLALQSRAHNDVPIVGMHSFVNIPQANAFPHDSEHTFSFPDEIGQLHVYPQCKRAR